MRNSKLSFLLSFLLIGCIAVFHANGSEDWPGFRGPKFDGTADGTTFAPEQSENLNVSWRAKGGPGYSGISIVSGKTVTAFSDGKEDLIVAYDSKSGKELWRVPINSAYKGHDGSHDGPIATPAIHAGKVFALGAYGDLAAIDLETGKKIWSVNVTKEGGRSPFYGYSASPLISNGVVVAQIGGEKGKAIAGFDAQTGKLKWSVGDDMVNYQSPVLMSISGKQTIIASSDKKLFFIDPANGKNLSEYEHGGDDAALILVPVPLDQNRLLLRNKQDSTDLVKLAMNDQGKVTVEKLWSAGVFKNSYDPPLYYKGHLYGFNGRILTCVNADTGETKWKSRAVGDGFLLLVNGYLVVQTKAGTLHVGSATPEGWKEVNQVKLFEEISWTAPSYADGAIFSRSHGEVARLDWSRAVQTSIASKSNILPAGSKFAELVQQLEKSADKKSLVDQFFASQKQFPIVIWPDQVLFVYRGPGEDIAITGDIQSWQKEDSMQRVAGTDLFFHTARLEPDARVNYRFIRNFEENIADPLNPKLSTDRRGNPISWFSMPGWQEPSHFKEAAEAKRGRFESKEIKNDKLPHALAKVDVYLPAGYDSSKHRYPVLYVMDGTQARKQGALNNTLDNLSGTLLDPAILVFINEIKTSEKPPDQLIDQVKATSKYFATEMIPFIDANYRTLKDRQNRAIVGWLTNAGDAFYIAFENSNLFGGIATQSMWTMNLEKQLKELITTPEEKPMRIYMDWGAYDARSQTEGWDLREANRNFYAFLKEKGYLPAGGETHEGYGWASWRNRNDRLLSCLFPNHTVN